MNVFSKSTLRAPLLYLFLLLVIGVVSFGFVGKAVEYVIVQRETSRLEGYYRAIGEILTTRQVDTLTPADGMSLIENDPRVVFIDRRRYSSGTLQGYYNTDFQPATSESYAQPVLNKGVNNLEFWFYGTLKERKDVLDVNYDGQEIMAGISLALDVDRVLAAYPDLMSAQGTYGVYISLRATPNAAEIIDRLKQMEIGQRYLLRGWVDPYSKHPVAGETWLNAFAPYYLRALDGDDLYYLAVPPGQEHILDQAQYASIRKAIALLEENLHAILITATGDMSALPWVQDSARNYKLEAGRWLNVQDEASPTCSIVISQDLAKTRGLQLGNTLSIKLRGLRDPYYGYIRGVDKDNWALYPSFIQDFEIVGIYDDFRKGLALGHLLDHNQAYISQTCLPTETAFPAGVDPTGNNLNDASFILNNPLDQEAFLAEHQAALAPMGLSIRFIDNNAKNFFASSTPIKTATAAGLFLFTLVLVLALGMSVFLYLRQQRRNYAIARALGLPGRLASRQMILPLLILGFISSLGGAIASWEYALGQAAESLSKLPTPAGVMPSISLEQGWLLGFWFLVFSLLFILAYMLLKRLQKKSVLDLLQQSTGKLPLENETIQPSINVLANLQKISDPPQTSDGAYPAYRALMRFGRRHLSRALVKSLLAFSLGLGFVLALGWLQNSIARSQAEIERLYQTTEVQADFVIEGLETITSADTEKPGTDLSLQNPFKRGIVERILESNYIKKVDLASALKISSLVLDPETLSYRKVLAHFIFSANSWGFLARDSAKGFQVNYLPGYDESLFTRNWHTADLQEEWPPLIVPSNLMADDGLALGETVTWWDSSGQSLTYRIVGDYPPGDFLIAGSGYDSLGEWVIKAGYGPMYAPIGVQDLILRKPADYGAVRFTIDPAYNRQLGEVKQELDALVNSAREIHYEVSLRYWDEELNAAVQPMEKNLSLLEVLYPVTVAVSVLIGFGLSLASVLQQAHESSLLRMLGVGVVPLRLLLSGTQLLLALAGVLVGLGLLALLRGPAGLGPQAFAAAGLYLMGVLLGTLLGATLISRRKPMELLQVKE